MPRRRRALLEAGVTTVRDVGNIVGTSLALKREGAAGRLAGPRVLAAGPMFTAPGGIPASTDFGGALWVIERITRQVSDPDAARGEVRRLAASGFEGVSAVCDGGVDDRVPRLDPTVLRAVVSEAHAAGLWATVATGRVRDVRDAIAAGADSILRGAVYDGPLPPDVVQQLRAGGVAYVPSLSLVDAFAERAERGGPPLVYSEAWETLRRVVREGGRMAPLAPLMETVRAAAAAGVRIGAGTATGGGLETTLPRELELLVAAGLSPAAALLAATRDGAAALHLERDLGTLEAGKLADLVLVAGRPWERIEDVRAVRLVIQSGRVVVDRS
jgi:imidazolonepropionase-like amidohydrolase